MCKEKWNTSRLYTVFENSKNKQKEKKDFILTYKNLLYYLFVILWSPVYCVFTYEYTKSYLHIFVSSTFNWFRTDLFNFKYLTVWYVVPFYLLTLDSHCWTYLEFLDYTYFLRLGVYYVRNSKVNIIQVFSQFYFDIHVRFLGWRLYPSTPQNV